MCIPCPLNATATAAALLGVEDGRGERFDLAPASCKVHHSPPRTEPLISDRKLVRMCQREACRNVAPHCSLHCCTKFDATKSGLSIFPPPFALHCIIYLLQLAIRLPLYGLFVRYVALKTVTATLLKLTQTT